MKLSQEQMVLRHLKDYSSLNCVEAFAFYSITQLHAVIHRLKAKGYNFSCTTKRLKNRYGEKHRIASYSLKGDIE